MGRWPVHRNRQRRLSFNFRQGDPFRRLPPGELLLEQITGDQLRAARNRGETVRKYQSRQFFELEAQRAANKEKITAALQSVAGISVPIDGWCRAIKLRYAHALLSCVGSLRQSGRFNYGADIDEQRFPTFPALYVAKDRATAHCEMFGYTEEEHVAGGLSGKALALQPETSIVYLALTGAVNNIFDLTQSKNLRAFLQVVAKFKFSSDFRAMERKLGFKPMLVANTTERLMVTFMDTKWRAFLTHVDLPANSQVFGQLVSAAGFEGIRYASVRTRTDVLAIFPRCFRNSSSIVTVIDPPLGAHCAELSSATYTDVERQVW
jgi:hypothetical protein